MLCGQTANRLQLHTMETACNIRYVQSGQGSKHTTFCAR